MKEKVAIIVVVYNEKNNLKRLFESLSHQMFSNYKIFLVDNNSHDGSLEYAKELNNSYHFNIEYIQLCEDSGYPGGNNIGAEKAIEQNFEYIFIINNDIELSSNCIPELINLLKLKKDAAVVAPVLLIGRNNKRTLEIQSFGVKANFYSQKKITICAGKMLDEIDNSNAKKVDYVSGAALLIKSDVVKNLGLFDENYFMYNDEIDLGFRLKNAGYSYYVTSKAIVWHHHDWSKKNISGYKLMYYYMMRNRVLYFKKFKLYPYLIYDLFLQVITFPLKVKMFYRIGSLSILKYYYLGLLRGLLGERGRSSINFH